jgi:hypothetical protein
MPNIMTAAEAEYAACYAEYAAARIAFYAGTVSPQDFIAKRKEMEAALAAWEAEKVAA